MLVGFAIKSNHMCALISKLGLHIVDFRYNAFIERSCIKGYSERLLWYIQQKLYAKEFRR